MGTVRRMTTRWLHWSVLAVVLLGGTAATAQPSGWDYDVTVGPDGRHWTVQLCVRGIQPRTLVLRRPDALRAIQVQPHPDGSPSFRPSGTRGAIAPRWGAAGCLRYTVSLPMVAKVGGATLDAHGALLNPGMVLLHPPAWPAQARVTVRFDAPDGVQVLTPWAPDASGRRVVDRTMAYQGSRIAVGRYPALTVQEAGATFEVAVLPGQRRATDEGIRAWIRRAARTVSDLFDGRFPVPRVLVVVVPSRASVDPVQFGRTEQAGGGNVTLYLSAAAADASLPDEWVAVHEFTHLGMPWMSSKETWLSEGFVTYYQEVLRGRSGHLTEQQAWEKLQAGFNRGRRSGTGRRLVDESRMMHQTHAYHRVYWGGAALALAADVAIRRHARGTKSLDDVMRHWHRTFPKGRPIPASDLLAAADRMLGFSACSGLARRFLARKDFPSLRAEFTALGLAPAGDRVRYLDRGAQTHDRTRIMRPGGR